VLHKLRTLMRYAADFLVSFRFYFTKTVMLFPNFLCLPLPFSRTKNVVVVHDLLFKHYPQYIHPVKRVVFDLNYRLVQKYADGVVFISKDTQDDFLRTYGTPRRYATIYNPIVLKGASPDVVRTVGPMDKPYVIANFHYYPHKNIEQLLDNFAQLHAQWPELQMVFTGNKPPEFDALVAPNAARHAIAHLGFLPKEQVMALIRDAAFFMSMSQFEGFNMSAAEAGLLGKPLVLSDIPVHRELFSECACFVDLNKPEVNAQAINAFVQHYRPRVPAFADQVKPEAVAQRYSAFIDEVAQA
jgi:glycosyltransferase involved in cell wall biosynthesis